MGYDVTRFAESSVDEELLCPICSGVLENPRQVEFKKFLLLNAYQVRKTLRDWYITRVDLGT